MDELDAGLRAVVHIKLVDPVFPGPTRRRLARPEAVWRVADTIIEQLPRELARRRELEADLRSRVPTRRAVAEGTYMSEGERRRQEAVDRVRRNTPIGRVVLDS